MFVMMGLSAVVPVIHGLKLYGLEQMRKTIGLDWVVLQGVLYILGAGIYAARVPEKWNPGRFDIWGSSHQIFHVLVVLAAASHLVGLIKGFDYEHSQRTSPVYLTFLHKIWS
jgi:adiponectin receptor